MGEQLASPTIQVLVRLPGFRAETALVEDKVVKAAHPAEQKSIEKLLLSLG